MWANKRKKRDPNRKKINTLKMQHQYLPSQRKLIGLLLFRFVFRFCPIQWIVSVLECNGKIRRRKKQQLEPPQNKDDWKMECSKAKQSKDEGNIKMKKKIHNIYNNKNRKKTLIKEVHLFICNGLTSSAVAVCYMCQIVP